jgi:chromosome segregation ATPase
VEANTLLEPGISSAANQNEQNEISDVSQQLASIKKKHDEAKKLVKQKEKEFEMLKKEIEQVTVQEQNAEGPVEELAHRRKHLDMALEQTMQKIAEETMTKHSYMHMLSRMKKDFIASKIKCTELDESLKSKRALLDLEQSKQRRTKEERLQSKAIFDKLMANIEKEQEDRTARIAELNRCISNKEAAMNRKIERQRKNQEIAETAASENKDSSELKWRQKLMINKLWNSFMRKKMDKEMQQSQKIDEAFKSIKTATSITDVDALVKRFLQREHTYT